MNSSRSVVVCTALLMTISGAVFAQAAGGAGSGAIGGGSGATTQDGTGKAKPNMGGATSNPDSTSSKAGQAPTRMPQNAPHAKGASDTAASTAQ